MKKFLAMLLVTVFLLTACQDAVDTSSDITSEGEVDDGVIDYTLVSVGKPYTLTTPSNETYYDKFDQQLTDGQKVSDMGAHYIDPRMVGFDDSCNIQIDLGEDGKRISAIVARALDMSIDGVTLAATATFRVSEDGETFQNVGTVRFLPTGDNTVSEARLELKEIKDCRYVRVYIRKGSGYFFFTDEVEVYADVPAKEYKDNVAELYKNETIDRNAWKSLSTGTEALPVSTENVVLNGEYTFRDASFDERAPKNTELLTDGERTNRYFGEDVWVGLNGNTEKTTMINFDLGSVRDDLYSFKVHALGGGINVSFPDYIDVFGSNDKKEYVLLGRMYAPGSGNNYVYTLLMPEYISARYIRFEFPKADTNYWLEEIEIIAGHNDEYQGVVYAPLDLPVVTEDIYWDSSEADYKTNQNLILGRPQQIAASYYAAVDASAEKQETSDKTTVLTDGKRCDDPYLYCYSGDYFYSGNGAALDFFYDLEKLSTVESINISLLEQTDWGIARPKHIAVFLSDDGTNWYKVYAYSRGDAAMNAGATALEFGAELDTPYAARFVRFRIENSATFIDEFEVFGTKEVKSGTKRLADSGIKPVIYYTNSETAEYATIDNTSLNADEIPIIYPNATKPENLLPFVAYLDKDGNIKDTFMDGFLLCNYGGVLPSGSKPHLDNYKQDWEYCFDGYFNGQSGLDVLEETVQQVKDALGLTDYKVKVYFTMLTVRETVTDFGDVDGDGVSEDLSTSEGRKKVVDWFTSLCIDEFNNRGYQNLEIDGFYWINEAVTWEQDDAHIITEVSEYVHATGYNFLWVPYYTANRYYLGYEMGFDAVSMQPNAVFDTDAPLWRIPSCADLTKAYNMCVEIEHSYQCLGDPAFARTYMLYLYQGAVSGYMDAIHVYYDDIENFAKMAYSDDELCRMQYDATYHFAKGDLEVTPPKKDTVKLSVASDTVLDGDLNPEDALSIFTLASAPESGYVTFSEDGSFRYFPDKGFKGTDSFTYTYNNYLGESEVCVVEITVG